MTTWRPEDLDSQAPDLQASRLCQLFASLLRFRGGWFDSHKFQHSGSSSTLNSAVSSRKV